MWRMVICILVIALAACTSCSTASVGRRDKIAIDGFMVPPDGTAADWPGIISIFTKGGAYEGGPYLEAVKDAGFGAYHAGAENLPELRKHGLKLFATIDDQGDSSRRLRDEPDVLGYWGLYPTTPSQWSEVAEREARLRKADPNHPVFYALEATWGQPDVYVNTINPRIIWYRHYLWEGHHPEDEFHGARWAPMNEFIYLEELRKAALAAGLPVVRWVHLTEPAKMRYTVSMSLVYGIRGFTWWQGWCFFDLKKKDERGRPLRNEIGDEVARLNRMMNAYSPVFKKARCVAAGHTWPWPLGYAQVPPNYWAQPDGAHITMGVFLDREGNTYHLLANRHIEKANDAVVRFRRPVESVSVMDKETGQWKHLPVQRDVDGNDFVKIRLDIASVEMLWPKPVRDRHLPPAFAYTPRAFTGSVLCRMIPPAPDGVIRYTLDPPPPGSSAAGGTEPTEASAEYKTPLPVDRSLTVRARFFHNDGHISRVSAATFSKVRPVAADGAPVAGLSMKEYKGEWLRLPDFTALMPAAGHSPRFEIPAASTNLERFGLVFAGCIRIPRDGTYTFYTRSDDGSRLCLDNAPVVNNDGTHGPMEMAGKAVLAAGLYPIRVEFFDGGGGKELTVSYEGPGIPKQAIPESALCRPQDAE